MDVVGAREREKKEENLYKLFGKKKEILLDIWRWKKR
jgi:hypothetical protein